MCSFIIYYFSKVILTKYHTIDKIKIKPERFHLSMTNTNNVL